MKKIGLLILLGAALLLVAAACSSDPTPRPDAPATPETQPTFPSAAGSSGGEQSEEAEEPSEESSSAAETRPEPTEVPLTDSGAATDIPVPEDAYKFQAMRKGSSVTYQVGSSIGEVVAWYQEELPKTGWELAGPPDSAMGAIATMLRENDDGDRLTINMQANVNAGFVSVIILVIRGGQ